MTVCIALTFEEGAGVVVASDRMTTSNYPPIEFEHKRKKIRKLNDHCAVLSSGDALAPKEILEPAKYNISQRTSSSIQEITDIVKEEYVNYRCKFAEDLYLKPRGITFKEFYNVYVNKWPTGMVGNIDQMIQKEDVGVRFIVAGHDSDKAHIYGLFDPGVSVCWDDLGYAAVGIGEIHAASFITPKYSQDISMSDAKKLILKAKRASEMAPGVGRKTDMAIITSKGFTELSDNDIKKLDAEIKK
ncbi:MAG: hypothetical protein IH964_12500 [Candidatus Dadabacteria bacterium]|nr:hypothetical protein [Candidatus Dadabacteria bacterium]